MLSAKKKGFTLIELMVVIAIIAVLAAVVTPQVFKQIQKGRVGAALAFSSAVKTAATSYFTDRSVWPAGCDEVSCNILADGFVVGGSANWDGPYLARWPSVGGNPWGYETFFHNEISANFGVPLSAPVGERWITMTGVPTADAQKLDLARDGVLNSASGMVRAWGNAAWPASGTLWVWILISRDGPVV